MQDPLLRQMIRGHLPLGPRVWDAALIVLHLDTIAVDSKWWFCRLQFSFSA
jgi:hypothetical protein